MPSQTVIAAFAGALLALCWGAVAAADEPVNPLAIRSIAEVESKTTERGGAAAKLMPADRVEPGDHVIYTLEVRNTGATLVEAPGITYAVPDHMVYVAGSAVGPGVDVSYSTDGGHHFDRPDMLRVPGPEGRTRPASPADYTHIRWRLKNALKANSVAFVRFRAVVK